jgi:hypothetical protein
MLEAEETPGPSMAGTIKSVSKIVSTSSGLELATFRLVA